ncbi:DUF2938 domain-containing protein [Rudaea sp.]|uniref:DUF2938 domain-containing protein n=1 Tax=Rudaea sp. TaxID=2136325 RepID=UPI0032203E63
MPLVSFEDKPQEAIVDYFASTVLIGAGATALTDLWAIVRKHLFGIPAPNYGLVGRWLAHMPRGRFRHDSIAAAPTVRGERLIGWIAHYLIGISYAAILLGIWGLAWIHHPRIGPALIVGIGTVAAPFLVMQPGMGAGIAASRTPRPAAARFQSLVTHAIFGLGLYASGWAVGFLYTP